MSEGPMTITAGPMTDEVGKRVRALREQKSWSLTDLASASGSSKAYIWDVETKKNSRPSAQKLAAIAQALGVTIGYLLGDDTLRSAEDTAFFEFYSRQSEKVRRIIREASRIIAE